MDIVTTTAGLIVALDLGKYKTVACVYDGDPAAARFQTLSTGREELCRLLVRHRPAVVVIEACGLAGWVYVAVRLDRTWFEFVWPRFDAEVCRMLRRWFGGQPTGAWTAREARVIRSTYLAAVVAALLACAAAASRAARPGP